MNSALGHADVGFDLGQLPSVLVFHRLTWALGARRYNWDPTMKAHSSSLMPTRAGQMPATVPLCRGGGAVSTGGLGGWYTQPMSGQRSEFPTAVRAPGVRS